MSTFSNFIILLPLIACVLGNSNAIENCPDKCQCRWVLDSLEVDCSGQGLTEYPVFAQNFPVEHLDLSNNKFERFPSFLAEIKTLMHLDLSHNRISSLRADALSGFDSLRTLLLANNGFRKWKDLNPNQVFKDAGSLHTLSLASNPIQSFSDVDETILLVSDSLVVLDASYCQLVKPAADFVLNGIPNLEKLVLRGNALHSLVRLPNATIKSLDLSECSLTRLGSQVLSNLPHLEELNLAKNPGLIFGSKLDGVMESQTLKSLDLSYCNLDSLELHGFPSLTRLNLKKNMIRKLTPSTFQSNFQLEKIDLSHNSISSIETASFSPLQKLTTLDLSFNALVRIDKNLFRTNAALTTLNLSRNFLSNFGRLNSDSLLQLNMSWCEITTMDSSAFSGLKSIREIDLSNNLLIAIPNNLQSSTLSLWDLKMCRLTSINQATFHGLPELTKLRLSGNRFTSPFDLSFFKSNRYLDEIELGDNPWRCDCADPSMLELYVFLTERPAKIKDKSELRCASPSEVYGKHWDTACLHVWFPVNKKTSPEKIWTIIMICIAVMGCSLFITACIKRLLKDRKERRNYRECARNAEELRDIRRQNRMFLEQEAQLNAPDPRESNPPCYEDALLMPKMERSFKSMVELSNGKSRDKLTRTNTDHNMNADEIISYPNRFRSEEVLCNRDKERTAVIGTFRRTGKTQTPNSGSRHFQFEDSRFPAAHLKAQNLESAEQIANFQSYENSPYTKRKQKLIDSGVTFKRVNNNSDSIEFLTDSESYSRRTSPFARRRPKGSLGSIFTVESDKNIAKEDCAKLGSLRHVDDYFGHQSSAKSSKSSDSTEFQMVNALDSDIEIMAMPGYDRRSSRDDSNTSEAVVVDVHTPSVTMESSI